MDVIRSSVVAWLWRSLLAALASMVVVLPVFWSMSQLHTWWNPPLDAIVFAVMLAVALPRGSPRWISVTFPRQRVFCCSGRSRLSAAGCS